MKESYYKPCEELSQCDALIEKYYKTQAYDKCFEGHMVLAKAGYPLAECQVGYFYWAGIGVNINFDQAFYWTQRSAGHGDRDAQYSLAKFYEEGIGTDIDLESARGWYIKAALQNHDMAIERCGELGLKV